MCGFARLELDVSPCLLIHMPTPLAVTEPGPEPVVSLLSDTAVGRIKKENQFPL